MRRPAPLPAGPALLAVVPVRGGVLPAGAEEAVAEASGHSLLVGEQTGAAAATLSGAGVARCAELGPYAPGRWAAALAPALERSGVVVLPASADGRDLAPRLAARLGRPLLAGANEVTATKVTVVRQGGDRMETYHLDRAVVATLLPGVREVLPSDDRPAVEVLELPEPSGAGRSATDATVVDVLPGDPATMDLSEAGRVLAGGAGLGDPARFELLARVAAALGAAPGATRVVADAGWVPHHRYIGTTGATVAPELYLAVGISGAIQHVTGVRHPRHLVAVNTDPSAPIMALADLAVVTDGPRLLEALARRLGAANGPGGAAQEPDGGAPGPEATTAGSEAATAGPAGAAGYGR